MKIRRYAHRDPTPDEPYAITVMVPQFLTEAAMRERLAELGHRPQYGVELKGSCKTPMA